jgi:hypothetical protein
VLRRLVDLPIETMRVLRRLVNVLIETMRLLHRLVDLLIETMRLVRRLVDLLNETTDLLLLVGGASPPASGRSAQVKNRPGECVFRATTGAGPPM